MKRGFHAHCQFYSINEKHKDKMAGVIMATDVAASSFTNKEGFGESSPEKGSQCQKNQGVTSSDVDRLQSCSELSNDDEKSDETLKGSVKSGLFVDAEVCHKMQQETATSASKLENKEFIEDSVSRSDNESEATGSRVSQDGPSLEQREQDAVNKKILIDPAKPETDFLEDMRIFEADAAASGRPRGPMEWILKQIAQDTDPRVIIAQLMPGAVVPSNIDDITLWKGVWELITEPKARKRLGSVNTLEDVVSLIQNSMKIIVLTGAGVSVSCGIPDFRSRDGIYARLSKDFPDLPDPQSMFDIHYFRWDQRPFFKFAKEIYPGQFMPSLSHRFIAALDKKNKLLRNYTQNIDTLEQVAGIQRVVQCHGSFATASCTKCKHKVDAEVIRDDIFNQVVPKCPICPQDEATLAVMKPDIIFFGEGLPDTFYQNLDTDKYEADLLIVIGSSLKVRPVAMIPDYVKPNIPQILINREPLHHFNFDVELLGNCDAVICELCRRLGDEWDDIIGDYEMPLLGKETVQKLFESSSESESNESDDTGEGAGSRDKREDSISSLLQFHKSNTNNEKSPSYLNSEVKTHSTGSVPVNLGHILCEAPSEGGSLPEVDKNTKETFIVVENENDSKDVTEKCSETGNSTQATPQQLVTEGSNHVVHTVSESSFHNDTHDQPHDAIGSQPNEPTDIIQTPDPIVSCSQIAMETQSHGSSEHQSHDALNNQFIDTSGSQSKFVDGRLSQDNESHPSVTHSVSQSSLSSVKGNSFDSAAARCQNSISSETHDTKSVDRKRIIDEVCKKCTECENRKVHERSEFSSEARLAQTNHSDFCKCGNTSKRKKLDSSSSLDTKDEVRSQRTISPSIDLHKDNSAKTAKHSASTGKKTKIEIRGNSPSFNKAAVMEKFDHEDIFYLYVPPNRYIFHGAELDTDVKFRHEIDTSSSEDEGEVEGHRNADEVKMPLNAEEGESAK